MFLCLEGSAAVGEELLLGKDELSRAGCAEAWRVRVGPKPNKEASLRAEIIADGQYVLPKEGYNCSLKYWSKLVTSCS